MGLIPVQQVAVQGAGLAASAVQGVGEYAAAATGNTVWRGRKLTTFYQYQLRVESDANDNLFSR